MKIINNTPFPLMPVPSRIDPPARSLTLVVKGTFDLVADGACTVAGSQRPIEGDRVFMDDIGRSLEWPSDLAAFKPHSDFLVLGSFHQPGGLAAPTGEAGFSFGPLRKELALFGPRLAVQAADGTWAMTAPEPFTSLPLRWEYSFGGMSDPRNPFGLGIDALPSAGGARMVPLPRIEDRRFPVRSMHARPAPVNFAPVPATFAERRRKLGTRDQRWSLFRAPLPPKDYDPSHANAAPADQQGGNYPYGDEELTLHNLHRNRPVLTSRLPGLRVVAAVLRRTPAGLVGEDVTLNLDTVVAVPDEDQLVLVWRGVVADVASLAAEDVVALQLELEPVDAPPLDPSLAARLRRDWIEAEASVARKDAGETAATMAEICACLEKAKAPAGLIAAVRAESDPMKLFTTLNAHMDTVIDGLLARDPAMADKVPQLGALLAERASQKAGLAV